VSALRAPSLAPLDVLGRLARLRRRLDGAEVDALVVTNLTNVRYLTGFTGSAALLAVTPNGAVLTTDGRYRTQAAEQMEASATRDLVDLVIGGGDEQHAAIIDLVGADARVGLEAGNVTWAQATAWAERIGRELVATTGVVEALREVKDAGEIDRMRHAAMIADTALRDVLPLMAQTAVVPITEEQFALALDGAMRGLGAESVAFETIVAAGENSAKPHHRPSSRIIESGDPVVVDFGATFEGYRSDMTRTFVVGGQPTGDLAEIFDVVRRSQAAGVAAVRPGVAASEVDATCRTLITDEGYGERFEHSTGHGVGLDIHEAPWVAARGEAILEPGVIVTVEPGVYVAGIGGVRIEDTLVVTADGAEPLTRFTKDVAA
jgi:Xaa-Pro aminopeptidase